MNGMPKNGYRSRYKYLNVKIAFEIFKFKAIYNLHEPIHKWFLHLTNYKQYILAPLIMLLYWKLYMKILLHVSQNRGDSRIERITLGDRPLIGVTGPMVFNFKAKTNSNQEKLKRKNIFNWGDEEDVPRINCCLRETEPIAV